MKPLELRRTECITVMLTPTEKLALDAKARSMGTSLSGIVRLYCMPCISPSPLPEPEDTTITRYAPNTLDSQHQKGEV